MFDGHLLNRPSGRAPTGGNRIVGARPDGRIFYGFIKALSTRSAEEKKALNIAGRYAPNGDPKATVLGETHWRWLEEQFRKPAEVRLLVSAYPVIPYELGRDAWAISRLTAKIVQTHRTNKSKWCHYS